MSLEKEIFEQLRPYLGRYIADAGLTTKKIGAAVYLTTCPECGEQKTPACEAYADSWYCHKCTTSGDVVDLCAASENISKGEALKALKTRYLEGGIAPIAIAPKPTREQSTNKAASYDLEAGQALLWSAGGEAVRRYLMEQRGLSEATLRKHKIGARKNEAGYLNAIFPNLDADRETPLPHVFQRGIKGTFKGNMGSPIPYNRAAFFEAVRDRAALFVVEGAIDALTIEQVGNFHAVATCSAGNVSRFLELIDSGSVPIPRLIIEALDGDQAGERGGFELVKGCQERGIPCFSFRLSEQAGLEAFSDANAAYTGRAILELRKALETAAETKITLEQMKDQEAEKMSVKPLSEELDSLIDAFLAEPGAQTTGFKGLDNILKGGFPASGMFVIGAAPATGKSALALALAANRAKNGGNALFFSCEMDKFELVTRLFASASELDQDAIEKKIRGGDRAAIPGFDKVVREILPRLSIVDLEGNPSIEIIEKTAEHFAQTKEKPLVVVDYLQLIKLSSAKDNQDTLFRLSEVAKRLKTLSKQCPIIVISSLNREGYKGKSGEADLTAFKASGDIEFSANWAAILEETPETREENGEKSLTLRVVKARRWRNKAEAYFKYKGACYKFTDAGSDDFKEELVKYQDKKRVY